MVNMIMDNPQICINVEWYSGYCMLDNVLQLDYKIGVLHTETHFTKPTIYIKEKCTIPQAAVLAPFHSFESVGRCKRVGTHERVVYIREPTVAHRVQTLCVTSFITQTYIA